MQGRRRGLLLLLLLLCRACVLCRAAAAAVPHCHRRHRHRSAFVVAITSTRAAAPTSTTRIQAKRPAMTHVGVQTTISAPGMIQTADGQLCFPLEGGVRPMPALGLGTFQVKGEEAYNAVAEALRRGYRLIDTAAVYRNEEAVGRAIRDSGLPREAVFVTSKLAPKDQGEGRAYAAMCNSVEALGLGYIDLYLIHWPGASGLKSEDPENARLRHESYRDLQRGFVQGKVRCLGVSNFNQRHLEALLVDPSLTHPPRVNQVEVHPFFPQRALRAFCRTHGILVQAYSSLGQNDPTLREHPVVLAIAAHRGMTPAQVLLRWALDQGMPVIPKTTQPTRMAENLAALTCPPMHADHAALAGLEKASGGKLAWDPAKVV